MLNQISFFPILGKPLIMYGGIATLIFVLAAASVPFLNKNFHKSIPMYVHIRLAKIAVIFALIHGLLGILAFF